MPNDGPPVPSDAAELDETGEPLQILLISPGQIQENQKSAAACLTALGEFSQNMSKARVRGEISLDARDRLIHADNLTTTILELLTSKIELHNSRRNSLVELSLFVRAYDLDYLRDAVNNASVELNHRPNEAGPTLHGLVPLLQAWVDSIIPSVLDDLQLRAKLAGFRIGLPPRAQNVLSAYQHERRISGLERQAETAVANLKQAAGEGGKERLAQTFEARATEETTSATNWNRLVMAFVALGIVLPLIAIVLGGHILGTPSTTTGVLMKALIGLPMFALATYSGRISAQHRKMAQHMKLLVAQIDSVKAYVEPLPTEVQQDIIATLGKRAFSEPGTTTNADGTVGIPPEQVLPVLEKAIEALKQTRK
ncbi:hypothetical protein [Mycobacterium sp. HM-7]